jgi:hypothetical protein
MVALLIAQNEPGNLFAGGALGKLTRDLTEPAPEAPRNRRAQRLTSTNRHLKVRLLQKRVVFALIYIFLRK